MIDGDLTGLWEFHPAGVDGRRAEGGIYVVDEGLYGDPPFLFRAVRQNGSRLHLRLLARDGTDARYPADELTMAGKLIERRAYTSDVRRGIYWTRHERTG